MQADVTIFRALNGLVGSGGFFDALVIFCARFLPYVFVLVVAWHLWLLRKDLVDLLWRFFDLFAPAMTASLVLGSILKELISRPRPFMSLPGVDLLVNVDGFAFPSSHASFFFALGFSVYLVDKVFGKRLLVAAAVISLARVMGGMHFPLDIVGGAVLGIGVSYIAYLWLLRSSQ